MSDRGEEFRQPAVTARCAHVRRGAKVASRMEVEHGEPVAKRNSDGAVLGVASAIHVCVKCLRRGTEKTLFVGNDAVTLGADPHRTKWIAQAGTGAARERIGEWETEEEAAAAIFARWPEGTAAPYRATDSKRLLLIVWATNDGRLPPVADVTGPHFSPIWERRGRA